MQRHLQRHHEPFLNQYSVFVAHCPGEKLSLGDANAHARKNIGSYNSHTVSHNGSATWECGTATFQIKTPGETTPSATSPSASYPTSTESCRRAAGVSDPTKTTVEATLNSTAMDFCKSYIPTVQAFYSGMSLQQYNNLSQGVNYYYTIGWDTTFNPDGCENAPPQQPPSTDECVSILYGNWKKCK